MNYHFVASLLLLDTVGLSHCMGLLGRGSESVLRLKTLVVRYTDSCGQFSEDICVWDDTSCVPEIASH